ncbi:hypothetical protein FZEAL_3866 [Fusarium zealandicum]|uniref:P-loop containing nucleoside triphosphate hydrolase protein n=1 Tax=Fusarium zealandicum TaxID=1053134 RepID=A0A8H4XLZ4_9HYPO|nr:hypothetical protein FZEAL_3866 [Fusarium zealandicum]
MSQMQTPEEKHPELFRPDLNIDRRKCTRTVPMEVLALGMSRTGTSSMQRALMILGYDDVYHGFAMFSNICEVELWKEALRRKYEPQPGQKPLGRDDFDQLLGHCGAICDYPANCFGPEMVSAYPDSKVVLVERDVDAWFKSYDESVIAVMFNPIWRFLSAIGAKYVSEVDGLTCLWCKHIFKATNKEELYANAREGYKRHYRIVRETTPPERLLEYSLKDGWEPLCAFLDKPVPDVPFPHINDKDSFHEKLTIIMKRGAKVFARRMSYVAVPGLVATAAYFFAQSETTHGMLSSWSGLAGSWLSLVGNLGMVSN